MHVDRLSLRVDDALLAEIKAYNEWAGIGRVDDFFDQAACFIFEKDKDWHKKTDQALIEM